jgi:hypothetical protein
MCDSSRRCGRVRSSIANSISGVGSPALLSAPSAAVLGVVSGTTGLSDSKTPVLRGLHKVALTTASRVLVCTCCPATTRAQRLGGFARQPGRGSLSPKGSSGRPAHRPFRGAHSRYVFVPSLCHQLVSGFTKALAPTSRPSLLLLVRSPGGLHLTGTRRLVTTHTRNDRFVNRGYLRAPFSPSESLPVSPRVLLLFAASRSTCA